MTNQARGYSLPLSLLAVMDNQHKGRSMQVREALSRAHKNPQVIVDALQRRLASPTAPTPNTRVTVSVGQDTLRYLSELTDLTQLGTEYVVRLSLESYLQGPS